MIKRVGNYELKNVLGEGSYGKVRLAENMYTGEKVAIKILDKGKIKQDNLIENLRQEIQIMKHIEHPNVVKLYEVLSSHSKIYLVIELVHGEELFHRISREGPLEEKEARFYFQQIISAVHFCQTQHVAHRDLKLENVLVDQNGKIKISDFGLSCLFKIDSETLSMMHTTCGTINYLAPEVFSNHGYDGHLADIWSCGVILYAMLSGKLPFEDDSIPSLIAKIVSGSFELPHNASSQALDVLKQILCTDPRTRISVSKLKKHAWFAEDYQEPQGRCSDVGQEIEVQNVEDEEQLPPFMNAFELLNYCCGIAINNMFDYDEQKTHFMTRAEPEKVMESIHLAFGRLKYKIRNREGKYDAFYIASQAPIIVIEVKLFALLDDLYLVNFSRFEGKHLEFKQAFAKLKHHLVDLIAS